MGRMVSAAARMLMTVVVSMALVAGLAGCGLVDRQVKGHLAGKAKVSLDAAGTGFGYQGVHYTILDEVTSKGGGKTGDDGNGGDFVAYLRVFGAYDAKGHLLKTEPMGTDMGAVKRLAAVDGVARVIPYSDIYRGGVDSGGGDGKAAELVVEVDGSGHRAVPADAVGAGQRVLDTTPDKEGADASSWSIDPQDITRLRAGSRSYTITEKGVDAEALGKRIADIDEDYTVDYTSKRILSQEELGRIDWTGQESKGQDRRTMKVGDIRKIKGQEVAAQVAIRVDGMYKVAQ